MRSTAIRFAACAVFFLTSQHASFAQWKRATGFNNSLGTDNAAGFFVFGNYLLADAKCPYNLPGATGDSLFASTDHGMTWKEFAPNGGVPLAAAGTTLFGSADTTPGVFNTGGILSYSTNNGRTWRPDTLGWPIPNGSAMSLLGVGNTVYMACAAGVYRQTAPGARWMPDTVGMTVPGTLFTYPVTSVVALGNVLFAAEGFYGGVSVSTNNGASWQHANTGLPTIDTVTQWLPAWGFAAVGASMIAMIAHDSTDNTYDFYRTTNNGTRWTLMNTVPENWSNIMPQIASSGQNIFAATDSGFYYSTNSGATWTHAQEGLPTANGPYLNALTISGGNVVVSTFEDGVWYRKLSDFGIF